MLITNPEQLRQYGTNKRIWQGIPSIERTAKGRLFAAFYSGGVTEQPGNFVVLIQSDDDGQTWTEPVAAVYRQETYRCYDQCLWVDPLGRLWLIWSVAPDHAVYAAICDNPDADTLAWGQEFYIGQDVMLNKPTVLSTGEWLFPIAVWEKNVIAFTATRTKETGPFVYRTADNGQTFQKLGCPQVAARCYDEHMVVELKTGALMMLTRTMYGISRSYSYDGGLTWTQAQNSGLGGPNSRFHIRRLRSGRLLLVNHHQFTGRNNLTAFLSDDDGKTWPHRLLLDERSNVSYPDMAEAEDGTLYIVYDRERGAAYDKRTDFKRTLEDAREILMARVTEDDIIAGELVGPRSALRLIINKLGEYDGDAQALYDAFPTHTREDLKAWLLKTDDRDAIVAELFRFYPRNCAAMQPCDSEALDEAIRQFKEPDADREAAFEKIVRLLEGVKPRKPNRSEPLIDSVLAYLEAHFTESVTPELLSQKLGVSLYYLCHMFKERVGISILAYRDAQRMFLAKKLLSTTAQTATQIAQQCGFDNFGHFSRTFKRSSGLTAAQYRRYHQLEKS